MTLSRFLFRRQRDTLRGVWDLAWMHCLQQKCSVLPSIPDFSLISFETQVRWIPPLQF